MIFMMKPLYNYVLNLVMLSCEASFPTWLDMIMTRRLGIIWLLIFNHICDYMIKSATWLNVWCDYKI
jgi:hypothetical protein